MQTVSLFGPELAQVPITAIVRGIRPQEILTVADALCSAGVRIVEIPMNSPEPLESLRILTRAYGNRMICGAGTLLDSQTALIASRVSSHNRMRVAASSRTALRIRKTLIRVRIEAAGLRGIARNVRRNPVANCSTNPRSVSCRKWPAIYGWIVFAVWPNRMLAEFLSTVGAVLTALPFA